MELHNNLLNLNSIGQSILNQLAELDIYFNIRLWVKRILLNISKSILKRWSGRLAPRPFSGNTFPREEMIPLSKTSYFLGNFLIKTKIATFKMANLF